MAKKLLAMAVVFIFLVGALSLTGCSENTSALIQPDPDTTDAPGAYEPREIELLTELPPIWEVPPPPEAENMADMFATTTLLQLSPLTPGELLATMHTSMGDITLRFFPTEAPIAVENFLTHAWDGYYDDVIFHRVIPDFMIQGGCPLGTGTGGESIWGGNFSWEVSPELRHFRGALAMAHTGHPHSIGSQFYIVQNNNLDSRTVSRFVQYMEISGTVYEELPDGSYVTYGDIFPEEAMRYFIDNGGTPHLDRHWPNESPHPVFGHVVSGMDVVDAIANVAAPGSRPAEDVVILGFSFHLYQGE